MFVALFAVLFVVVLGGAFVALPFFFTSAGALTAIQRPECLAILHSVAGRKGTPAATDSLIVATRRYVFVVPIAELRALEGYRTWYGAASDVPVDRFLEQHVRGRLSDPSISADVVERAHIAELPGTFVIDRKDPALVPRMITAGPRQGLWLGDRHVPIRSRADALALARFLYT